MRIFAHTRLLLIVLLIGCIAGLASQPTQASNAAKAVPVNQARMQFQSPTPTHYVPGEILVRFQPGTSPAAANSLLNARSLQALRSVRGIGVQVVRVPAGQELSVASALSNNPIVEFAEVNGIYQLAVTPDDPSYGSQWGLTKINAPTAWDTTTGSASVIVAVIDTGVDLDHPDLDGKVMAGYDFANGDADPSDDNGHGSHVAGIAAAESNNATGVAGVSWGATIMPIKVFDSGGNTSWEAIANGIDYAATNGADIINMSIAGESYSATLQTAIDNAYSAGLLTVAASGNCAWVDYFLQGCASQNPIMYPAAMDHVVSVGATASDDSRAPFSNYNQYVDVTAPGLSIYSTVWNNTYSNKDGTSMASPFVAGLAALVWSANPDLTNDQVEAVMKATAVDLGTAGKDNQFGYGRINAAAAVALATPATAPVIFNVDTTADNAALSACTATANDCSLRGAIIAANTNDNATYTDIINVPAGTYTFAIPSTNEDAAADGDLDITQSVNIVGAGAETTIIQAATEPNVADDRVFHVLDGVVGISGVTVRNGYIAADGGGILTSGQLTVTNSIVSHNTVVDSALAEDGGGIYNSGTLEVINSTISNNSATGGGGGIANSSDGTTTVNNSTISGNSADLSGGGILNSGGTMTVDNGSTVSGNTATWGGGIARPGGGTLTISSSTVSGNNAPGGGGGIRGSGGGIITVSNSTISGNSAVLSGGGIYRDSSGGTILNISNSIISNNSTSTDGGGIYMSYYEVTISGSTISGNYADRYGGGIYNSNGALTISSSMISGNTADWDGGGIYHYAGLVNITSSTISNNGADNGGGIYNDSFANYVYTVNIASSTISNNIASIDGGGIYNYYYNDGIPDNDGTVNITSSTISDNLAFARGGGIFNGGKTTLDHTLVSNGSGNNCFNETMGSATSDIISEGYNLSSDESCTAFFDGTGDLNNVDPMLTPLRDYGGATLTHALLPGSPAIDAGDPSFVSPPVMTSAGKVSRVSRMVGLILAHLNQRLHSLWVARIV